VGKHNYADASLRSRAIDGTLLLVIAFCLAYFARSAYTEPEPEQPPYLSIAPADTIAYITVIDRMDSVNSHTVWRPRYIRSIAESLAKAEASDVELTQEEGYEAYSIFINAWPSDEANAKQLKIYMPGSSQGDGVSCLVRDEGGNLYALSREAADVLFAAVMSDRAEFLPSGEEAQIAICTYRGADGLKSAIISDTTEFTSAFDTRGVYFDRYYEEAMWLMSVDFATDEETFGQKSKVYYLLRGESGQIYIADGNLIFPIDEVAYSVTMGFVESLDPKNGYAAVDDGDVYSMSVNLYEEGLNASVSDLEGMEGICEILKKVGLPVYLRNPVSSERVITISLMLNNNAHKPLQNVGLLNYVINRTKEGEYVIGSSHSVFYPYFHLDEKDVEAIIGIVKRSAGQQ